MRSRRRCVVALGLAAWIARESPAAAQATVQFPVQFEFLAPGARSLALGGAFIAAADDATAAFTNPAGLAFIGRREVSFEGRYRRVDTPYLAGGRVSGLVTGRGPDTIPTPVYARDIDSRWAPTYFAFMLPLKANATITAYRHEVTAVDNSFFYEGAFKRSTFGGLTDDRGRDIPLGGTRTARIINYGVSVGYQVVPDKFAVGGGLSLYQFSLESRFARYGSDLFGPVDTSIVSARSSQDASDNAPGFNVGGLWWPRPAIRFGMTYRRSPRFSFRQDDNLLATGDEVVRNGRFKVPDTFGAGISWRAVNRAAGVLRVLVDYDRVQYSQLKTDFIDFQAIATKREAQLVLDDGNEVHGGIEFRMLQFRGQPLSKEVALRGGAWFDPNHTVRYVPNAVPDELDPLLSAMLPGASGKMHYTFGAGVNWSRWLNVSAAADLSSGAKHATVSAELIIPR
jgi:long-chain fatty acid transport protein